MKVDQPRSKVRCYAVSFLMLILSSTCLHAQERTSLVKGLVQDYNNNPVSGVSVIIRNTKNNFSSGVNADSSGIFSFSRIPSGGPYSFTFSAVGYESQTLSGYTIKEDILLSLVVKMKPVTATLNEVLVVGYGTMRKKDVTGSVSHVKMSDMQNKEAVSIADYLRGSVAGLNISRSSSVTGAQSFEIRGATSIGASTQPLIVVDGMIFSGLLNDINPSDIEAIDVLKDASSTAIYGSRAAAGVILLTTKQGKTEKPVINFDERYGVSSLLKKEKAYDVNGYFNMRSDAMASLYTSHANQPEYYKDPRTLQSVDVQTWLKYDGAGVPANADPMEYWLLRLNLYPGEIANYKAGKSVDWVNSVFRPGTMQDYNASISGKTSNLNYYWSLGMLDNKGIITNDDYRNIRTRVNITSDITSYLQTGMRINLSSTTQDNTAANYRNAYQVSPLGDLYDDKGHYRTYPNTDIMGQNPFDKTQYIGQNRNMDIIGSLFTKIKLPFNINYELDFNNRWGSSLIYVYKPSYTIDALLTNGSASRQDFRQYDWSLDNILRWDKTFAARHRINVLLLYNSSRFKSQQTNANATNFTLSEALNFHNLSLGATPSVNSDDQQDTRASALARINYAYDDKYLLTASFRRDGYSAFGQANPWADFPSVAIAWRMSRERFMKSARVINDMKLRLSYGVSGNSGIGRYTALSQLTNGNYVRDGQTIISLYPTSLSNKDLKWEETSSLNAGLDISMFNNRINATIDLYSMTTKNMLLARTLPTLTGFTSVMSNLGQLDNKGAELTINAVPVQNAMLKWNIDFNFSLNRNKIMHLYGDMINVTDSTGKIIGTREVDDPTNGRYIGHALDEIYGYQVIGVWQTSEKVLAAKYGRVPGDYKTNDPNNDGKLEPLDYMWQGYTKPRFRFSMRNSFTINNSLDISFLARANIGYKKVLDNNAISSGYADRVSQAVYPYWTPVNQSNTWARLGFGKTGNIYTNASFLRIDDFSIGYRFSQQLLSKLKIRSARIYLNIDNVWSLDKSLYWDIETGAPTPTTFTTGISISL
ncbi:MAG: TonB-linked outer membrane protein SusC/RagA family [Chitinophagaceae bacterium]|nr:TonB-linked outer membrane protein SusC/RagA family [Chitinophagaceae bacterium]